ncbi:MAG: hypothetical protein WAS21_07535 [Geminicoccaceae bacterium]
MLLLLTLASASADGMLDAMLGRWSAAAGGTPVMEWSRNGDGFTVRWTPPGHDPVTVGFEPAGRPGVLVGKVDGGWSMFGDGTPNPLEGKPLYWARTTEDAIYLYSLEIHDRGDFELDRYATRREGDTLSVTLLRRTAAGMQDPVQQALTKVDQ